MKKLMIFFILLTGGIQAQEWQSIYYTNYLNGSFTGGMGNFYNRNFKISPYDNSIWMAKNSRISHLDNAGNFEYFDYSNSSFFGQSNKVLEFAFAAGQVFAVDATKGLIRYNNTDWELVIPYMMGNYISWDADTIWLTKNDNTNYLMWKDGFNFQGNFNYFRRIISKNGQMWASPGEKSSLVRYKNNTVILYSPDTSLWLDQTNYDFKFSRLSDTLYVAGARGISKAFGNKFVDTITPGNSVNMPGSSIIEIEFDSQDNFWALFGNASFYPNAIAYYDHGVWKHIYNADNSPIDFTRRISIEVDTLDNLWVADGSLHVLKLHETPAWLGLQKPLSIQTFDVYPNPASGVLNFDVNAFSVPSRIEVLDLSGRVVFETAYADQVDVALSPGSYFVRLFNDSQVLGTRKFVIE